jgi:hypothetical protein
MPVTIKSTLHKAAAGGDETVTLTLEDDALLEIAQGIQKAFEDSKKKKKPEPEGE